MKKYQVVLAMLLLSVALIIPLANVVAATPLPEGRSMDEVHDTGYIDWSGSPFYYSLYHRDSICPSGCYETVTAIPSGSTVSGSFLRDLTYFEVMLATVSGQGFGTAILTTCGTTGTYNTNGGSSSAAGYWSVPQTVPSGCRNWSLTATGGTVYFRSVDANYVPAPPTSTPTNTATRTPTPTFTLTPTLTFTPTFTTTALPTATASQTATSTTTNTAVPTSTHTAIATSTGTALPTGTYTATSTATATATGTLVPTATSTSTATAMPTSTRESVVVTVPVIIINNNNSNTNSTSGGGGGGSSGGGNFSAVTPAPMQGQGGMVLWNGVACGGYYLRMHAYVDDNQDGMMSPAEGITGLQAFFLDANYARLGSSYTLEGQTTFCIPPDQYGKSMYVDVPYLQKFASVSVPESPTKDLEVWFPGKPPELPLYLP